MRRDLLPLLHGNLVKIAEVRRSTRRLDIEHREWMICLGRGFDFLHTPTTWPSLSAPTAPTSRTPSARPPGSSGGTWRRDFPYLAPIMSVHTAVLDWRSRTLETVAGDPPDRE